MIPHTYESPPMRIGDHDWRIVVMPSRFPQGAPLVTEYQFRRAIPFGSNIASERWIPDRDWPTYDSDNGVTAGLPVSLRRLFDREKAEVYRALGKPAAAGDLL